MEDNDDGRCGPTRTKRLYYIGQRYLREAGPRGGTGANQHKKKQNHQLDGSAAERIAKEERLGQATVERAAKMAEHIDAACACSLVACGPRYHYMGPRQLIALLQPAATSSASANARDKARNAKARAYRAGMAASCCRRLASSASTAEGALPPPCQGSPDTSSPHLLARGTPQGG
jgi:hypothetical protein